MSPTTRKHRHSRVSKKTYECGRDGSERSPSSQSPPVPILDACYHGDDNVLSSPNPDAKDALTCELAEEKKTSETREHDLTEFVSTNIGADSGVVPLRWVENMMQDRKRRHRPCRAASVKSGGGQLVHQHAPFTLAFNANLSVTGDLEIMGDDGGARCEHATHSRALVISRSVDCDKNLSICSQRYWLEPVKGSKLGLVAEGTSLPVAASLTMCRRWISDTPTPPVQ
ncbi:hypothetical protein ZHAS_00003441 [Anopheles sinensis]|uniref:Uncharacterized protein n=1 Tax=Anopheles sinensis TaxID=74873 RepID=A0A084VEC4_ANOSI|nr:hypothetical protein ZHAS_00003441 [Anopheles sinensis]